jgi:hypothetical protein
VSATTFGWLILLFPAIGTIILAVGYRRMPGNTAGWLGSAR